VGFSVEAGPHSIFNTERHNASFESQSVNRSRYCSVWTFPLKMHFGGKMGENRVGHHQILTPKEPDPNKDAEFHQN